MVDHVRSPDTSPTSEIKITGISYAQRDWAFCDGTIVPVDQYNKALLYLLGAVYGGDGKTDFGLPDLRSRAPMGAGAGSGLTFRPLGEKSGNETVALTTNTIANHGHTMKAVGALGDTSSPFGNSLAQSPTGRGGYNLYAADTNRDAMASGALAETGKGQAHDNMQPCLPSIL